MKYFFIIILIYIKIAFQYEYLKEKYKLEDNKKVYLMDPSFSGLLSYSQSYEEFEMLTDGINLQNYEYIFIPINDNEDKFKAEGLTL